VQGDLCLSNKKRETIRKEFTVKEDEESYKLNLYEMKDEEEESF